MRYAASKDNFAELRMLARSIFPPYRRYRHWYCNAPTNAHTYIHTYTCRVAELFKYIEAEFSVQFSVQNPHVIRSYRSQKPKYSFLPPWDDNAPISTTAVYWKQNCQPSKIFISHKRSAACERPAGEKRTALSAIQSPLGRLLLQFSRTIRHSSVAVDRAAWKNSIPTRRGDVQH